MSFAIRDATLNLWLSVEKTETGDSIWVDSRGPSGLQTFDSAEVAEDYAKGEFEFEVLVVEVPTVGNV